MKFATNRTKQRTGVDPRRRGVAGFTLAEVLAALVFMAIVIPVAMRGLQIATRAGEVAQRKAIATRVGERVLGEIAATHQMTQQQQRGSVKEGPYDFQFTTQLQPWERDAMRTLTVEVLYSVQGQEHSVRLTTLVGNNSL